MWYGVNGSIKAYNCVLDDLLLAKTVACGFSTDSLELTDSNLGKCLELKLALPLLMYARKLNPVLLSDLF